MGKLGINWYLLIAQLINFGLLAFLLARLLYRPVLNALHRYRPGVRFHGQEIADLSSLHIGDDHVAAKPDEGYPAGGVLHDHLTTICLCIDPAGYVP